MKNKYPDNWKEISEKSKKEFNYCCERCGKYHNPKEGYCLTVHHLDMDTSNNEKWNLAVLCQRCHLHIQKKVVMNQDYFQFLEVSEWFKPHLEGYLKSKKGGQNA